VSLLCDPRGADPMKKKGKQEERRRQERGEEKMEFLP
jgi:hypothetical protein